MKYLKLQPVHKGKLSEAEEAFKSEFKRDMRKIYFQWVDRYFDRGICDAKKIITDFVQHPEIREMLGEEDSAECDYGGLIIKCVNVFDGNENAVNLDAQGTVTPPDGNVFDPQRLSEAPDGEVFDPQRLSEAPNGDVFDPQRLSEAPDGEVFDPQRLSEAPNGDVFDPQRLSEAPDGEVFDPQRLSEAPDGEVFDPQRLSEAPNGDVFDPERLSEAPDGEVFDPQRLSEAPDGDAVTEAGHDSFEFNILQVFHEEDNSTNSINGNEEFQKMLKQTSSFPWNTEKKEWDLTSSFELSSAITDPRVSRSSPSEMSLFSSFNAPDGNVFDPQRLSEAPNGDVFDPQRLSEAPDGEVFDPQRLSEAPNGDVFDPQRLSEAPDGEVFDPQRLSEAPDGDAVTDECYGIMTQHTPEGPALSAIFSNVSATTATTKQSFTMEELRLQLEKEDLKRQVEEKKAIVNILTIGNMSVKNHQVHRHRGPLRPQFQGGQRLTRMPMQDQPSTVHPNMHPKAGQQHYYQQYNPAAAQPQMSQQPIRQPVGQEPLNTHLLAQASDAEQKQIISERLFHLVSRIATNDDVGKITGMLLQLDNSELWLILKNDDMLKSKVAEATAVLHGSQKEPQRD